MFSGPIQVVYYFFRAIAFFTLLPYNAMILFLDLAYIPVILLMWFFYFLKAVLWYMDVAYIVSN